MVSIGESLLICLLLTVHFSTIRASWYSESALLLWNVNWLDAIWADSTGCRRHTVIPTNSPDAPTIPFTTPLDWAAHANNLVRIKSIPHAHNNHKIYLIINHEGDSDWHFAHPISRDDQSSLLGPRCTKQRHDKQGLPSMGWFSLCQLTSPELLSFRYLCLDESDWTRVKHNIMVLYLALWCLVYSEDLVSVCTYDIVSWLN